ncbi:MAG: urease accessory protein UreD [Gammaproteobacteria bacterium]|nr:urease accessory protein UreD [Gammaproteobacteria bacterium]
MISAALSSQNQASWKATLDLCFAQRNNKTNLTSKKHSGPLIVQKPFYPEANGCCHIYLIHPPGGIVGGDSLNLSAQLDENSHALITTPAATKFYRSTGIQASQNQVINLKENAILEWLPQETVYFNDTNAASTTRINLNKSNRFFAWEIQCLGLPAQQEYFISGQCRQKLEIWREDKPVLLETNRLIGGDELLNASWGLQGHKSVGTFVISDGDATIDIETINTEALKFKGLSNSYTSMNGLLIIRAMSAYAEIIKKFFAALWEVLRPQILQLESSTPRIWHT